MQKDKRRDNESQSNGEHEHLFSLSLSLFIVPLSWGRSHEPGDNFKQFFAISTRDQTKAMEISLSQGTYITEKRQ